LYVNRPAKKKTTSAAPKKAPAKKRTLRPRKAAQPRPPIQLDADGVAYIRKLALAIGAFNDAQVALVEQIDAAAENSELFQQELWLQSARENAAKLSEASTALTPFPVPPNLDP